MARADLVRRFLGMDGAGKWCFHVAAVLLSAALVSGLCAEAVTLTFVSIKTRSANQTFILIKPDVPIASVVLFAGGHGALGLSSASTMRWGASNFLVRTRSKFAAHDFMVAVMDAPSDHQDGMTPNFRMSREHAEDISAVAKYLRGRANVPVWLVGTSMGTFSAANGAIAATDVDGLVLVSTITRPNPGWKIAAIHGVASMHLASIKVPTLILSHRDDQCEFAPATGASELKNRLTASKLARIELLAGGARSNSEPCAPMAPHGFFGIEDEAIDRIADFIKEQSNKRGP
jgi:predicted alpha/beta-hydrolase family hydrolase